jgi:hypothetical protein
MRYTKNMMHVPSGSQPALHACATTHASHQRGKLLCLLDASHGNRIQERALMFAYNAELRQAPGDQRQLLRVQAMHVGLQLLRQPAQQLPRMVAKPVHQDTLA